MSEMRHDFFPLTCFFDEDYRPSDMNKIGGPAVIAAAERHREIEKTPHKHLRGQLMIAIRGLITVHFLESVWLVPSGHSVWLPPLNSHSMHCHGPFERSGVYIDEYACVTLPGYATVIPTSALLREALIRTTEWAESDAPLNAQRRRVVEVLVDEIRALPVETFVLTIPRDLRLERVARALIENPMDERDLKSWAHFAEMSPRGLTRGFLAYTGFNFADWRQRVRLLRSLEMLTTDIPITDVARGLGYASPGTYISVFKRTFRETPAEYRKRL